jgi:hypothetical protein
MDEMNDHEMHRLIDREVSNRSGLIALILCLVAIAGILVASAAVLLRQFG